MYSSQTPIDIHCSKLVDWLVQHRHCRKDWGENLASIRRKIRAALKDMPEHPEIKELLIGSKLDYFKSKKIVEILRETEASSKNFLGYYSSQRMKDWQDIVYSYEKDHIYLAEISTDLIRETNYEVPGVRRVISELTRQKDESEREKANLLRRAQQFQSEYQKMAQSYGLKGVNVAQELNEQSKLLPSVMDELVELAGKLKSDLDYYRKYASSTSGQDSSKFVPVLAYVLEKGNTTVYEFNHGEAPERIIADVKTTSSTGTSNPSIIELMTDEIDFGDDLPSSESSSGFVHVPSKPDEGVDEQFVKLDGSGDSTIVCDSNEKVARGDEAKLVLELRRTRFQYLNNLHELEAFYEQLSNTASSQEDQASAFLQKASVVSPMHDSKELVKIKSRIRDAIEVLNKESNKILFQMNDSTSFVENLCDKFASKAKQSEDCNTKANYLTDKIKDLEIQIKETESHLKKSIFFAKELQERVESSLMDLYKGRSINIMGCFN